MLVYKIWLWWNENLLSINTWDAKSLRDIELAFCFSDILLINKKRKPKNTGEKQ